MERKYEKASHVERHRHGIARMASETIMANLPILVCGLVVGLAMVKEIFNY